MVIYMDLKINKMIEIAKNKISDALTSTEFSSYINEIIYDYVVFIKACIENGLIKSEEDLELFRIDDVKYFEGNSYA